MGSLFWQVTVPGRDFYAWAKCSRRLGNSCGGCELRRMRRKSPHFPRYLRAHDRTSREAAGFHDPFTDKTAKFKGHVDVCARCGCRIDIEQFQNAWSSTGCCNPSDAVNRLPMLWSDDHGGDARRAVDWVHWPLAPGRRQDAGWSRSTSSFSST
ncbi:unnamed protein product [Prorocentrum cordatum]|uniref:Uncharacterized protein n=1 Tax=Prorocentrum cordatum TaxID=2364126 RepID=A0ABN9UJL1_9DINO|nr:unnamed protein product [Polarella glacialis]